jgi:protein-disulfide isomerase
MSNGSLPGANPRRDEAREKAKAIREQHRKQEKRSRAVIQAIVVLFSIAIIGIITLFIVNSIRPAGPGPLNMRSDGIVIGEGLIAQQTPATQPGDDPVPTSYDKDSGVVAIVMYVDYFCPICGAFDEANGDQIETWVNSGAATVEIHPLAVLDRVSQGTKYSTRSANAAACVANYSPDQYFAFHTALFESQPEENTAGLTDEELVEVAVKSKVTAPSAIKTCIEEQKFKAWVSDAKDRALTGPIPNSNVDAITSPPTIIVNGLKYTGAANDAAEFSAFVVQAAGASFNESSTSSPTPTPAPAP